MRTLYKILFEVKVLHEYYLTDPPGTSIFGLVAQSDRMQFLADRSATDVMAVNEDMVFYLDPAQQTLFRNNHLILLNSYSGCQVAVKVSATTESDGSVVYTPVFPLPADLNMLISIAETRNFIDVVTSARMNRPVAAARYFSNEQVFASKAFPFLSTPLQAQQAGYAYEQGELASFGAADVRSYYYYGNADQWLPVTGTGFSGEQDRLVVSPRFFYGFLASDGVRNASFALRDGGGNTIDTRTISKPTPMGQVVLDYSNLLKSPPVLKTLPLTGVGGGLLYTLSVTGDNGYSRQVPLVFYFQDPHSAPMQNWGWVQVQTMVSNTGYNLLDPTGLLITRIKADGTVVLHPVFEIWMKSRFTFWRYQNDDGGTLKTPTPDIGFFLDLVNGELITKAPRNITYRPTWFHNPNDNSDHFLPNPESDTVPETDARQVFSNIPVPESNLFPIN